MLESLTDMMFGTPARFRTSLMAFLLVGAIIFGFAAAIRPYRCTILIFGGLLIFFYAQLLLYLILPPVDLSNQTSGASVFERTEASMMQFRALMPWLIFIFGPLGIVAQFVADRPTAASSER